MISYDEVKFFLLANSIGMYIYFGIFFIGIQIWIFKNFSVKSSILFSGSFCCVVKKLNLFISVSDSVCSIHIYFLSHYFFLHMKSMLSIKIPFPLNWNEISSVSKIRLTRSQNIYHINLLNVSPVLITD